MVMTEYDRLVNGAMAELVRISEQLSNIAHALDDIRCSVRNDGAADGIASSMTDVATTMLSVMGSCHAALELLSSIESMLSERGQL